MLKSTAFPLTIFILCIPSFAWGPRGHRVAADVARHRLTPLTRQKLVSLLGSDDLASISTWADEIRNERTETFGWHFVDIPWNASGFSEPRDCYHPRDEHAPDDHHNCVVDRILIFQRLLGDKRARRSDRMEALKFLIHFVGDVHQPLHAIEEARGGNDIHVMAFGSRECGSRPCNLHFIWDEALIAHTRRSERHYAEHLDGLISRQGLEQQAAGSPADWADESFRLAHRVWLSEGGAVDETYYRKNIEIVDRQLALAGLRLAALLNSTLGH
jgi:hypothetical protein